MAKKGALGKLIAFTTAVAAIGGVCYVFRDKIKESSAFKTASDKANDLYDTVKSKMNKDDDDFFFDDDDFFDETDDFADTNDSTGEREYTSILSKQSDSNTSEEADTTEETDTAEETDTSENIPTIDFNSQSPTAYENEGLSDVSEDPDVLEDMDKLDN